MTHYTPSHERLDAYRVAIELFRGAGGAAQAMPRGYGDMKDQLRRAAAAVARNIAEGASRHHPGDPPPPRLRRAKQDLTLSRRSSGSRRVRRAVRLRRLAARTMALIGGLIRYQRRLAARSE